MKTNKFFAKGLGRKLLRLIKPKYRYGIVFRKDISENRPFGLHNHPKFEIMNTLDKDFVVGRIPDNDDE